MKILVDLEEVKLNRLNSSIPLYIFRFLDTIPKCEYKNIYLLISEDIKEFVNDRYPYFRTIELKRRGLKIRGIKTLGMLYTQYKINKIIKDYRIDIFFVPSDIQLYTSFKVCCRKVIVIHDLKALKLIDSSRTARKLSSVYNLYNDSILYSDVVIAISNYTKEDIQRFFPDTSKDKVKVIYNSIVLPYISIKPDNFNTSQFILYVNALQPYKNVFTLVQAFNNIKDKYEYDLVIVGRPTSYWEEVVVPYIKNSNIENRVIHLYDLSDENIKYLYENAILFITTSLHEGFGYTPIEAAALNCPVISSVEESLPDTTQGLLNYYLNTKDPESLTIKIEEVLNDLPNKDELQKISNKILEIYSPHLYIKNLYDVFRAN